MNKKRRGRQRDNRKRDDVTDNINPMAGFVPTYKELLLVAACAAVLLALMVFGVGALIKAL